jgi:hypothetical protein
MAMEIPDDRRRDPLLRDIVCRCQTVLEPRGFRLDGRGSADAMSWVRFGRHTHDDSGEDGTLVLLLAHDRRAHALLAESRFADHALAIDTPRGKRVQYYAAPADPRQLARELIDDLASWPNAP